jgi:DNA modification methylase
MDYQLHHGDCLEVLKTLPDNSVDSIVTDPPYGLSFMGKKWDYDVPSEDVWRECLRVLKPGGHLLAFAGTRTQHRMAVRIEDAGFEIRDMIAWVYGSGFPKSLDVSKAIDKAAGAEREVVGFDPIAASKANKRQSGEMNARYRNSAAANDNGATITAPATDAAREWAGWGTALKPSWESVTVATKPLDVLGNCAKTIANLNERIESWRQIANNAEKSSRHSQADLQEVRINTAPESAATRTEDAPENRMETGLVDATSSRVDTLELTREEELTALNTLLSWKNTLEGVFNVMRTSTTATVFETITDWKILSYCLSQTTLDTITKAKWSPNGLSADALRAVDYLNASLACCKSTLALSVLEPAMFQEAENCRDVGVQPNLEPCIVARKPLGEKTVAANVLEHGTGAINVDGCRIAAGDGYTENAVTQGVNTAQTSYEPRRERRTFEPSQSGRWPANLIHDGSDEVVGLFPETKSSTARTADRGKRPGGFGNVGADKGDSRPCGEMYNDSGSAARFFYCAKASKKDRDEGCEGMALKRTAKLGGSDNDRDDLDPVSERFRTQPSRNNHPTVKPAALMRYLCRLVTPPGGTVLDPFMGSGSTGKAAVREGFEFIGIEREAEYAQIAKARIERETAQKQLL